MTGATSVALAADIEWTGLGQTPRWSEGANWKGGVAPGKDDKAVIPSGQHVYMAGADISFAVTTDAKLAGISFAAADATLSITNTKSINLSVPISGNGTVRILNCGKGTDYGLLLGADNSNYTGPMLISNSVCSTDWDHVNAFGKNNCVTNYLNRDKTVMHFFKSQKYTTTFQLFGITTYVNSIFDAHASGIEFTKPITVNGYCELDCSSVKSSTVTISGGLHHEGPGYVTTFGNWTIVGTTPLKMSTTTDYASGFLVGQNTLSLGSPVDLSSPRVAVGGSGVLKFTKANILSPAMGLQIGVFNKYNGSIDLNGYDQEVGSVYKMNNGGNVSSSTYITSATPATLTVCGQLEWWGNHPSDETRYLPFALKGAASLEFNGTNRIVNSSKQVVWPKITQTNAVSTTTGGIGVRRGTYTITADNQMPNLTRLEVSNEGELVVNTSDINPGHFNLMVTNLATRTGQYPLTLNEGVTLEAYTAAFGDNTKNQGWLNPGTYGGTAAREAGLVDDDHTISYIGGKGLLKVNRHGHPGLVLSIY